MTVIVPAQPIDASCPECDRRALKWSVGVATEAHLAVVVRCRVCSHMYPVCYVNRRTDTRRQALAAIAQEVVAKC